MLLQHGVRRSLSCASRRHGASFDVFLRTMTTSSSSSAASDDKAMTRVAELNLKVPLMKAQDLRFFLREHNRAFREFQENAESNGGMDMVCASVIERLPVVIPDLEDWEIDFLEIKQDRLLRKNKYMAPSIFPNYKEKGVLRRDELWAIELLDRGSNGRLGPLAYAEDIKTQVEQYRREEAEKEAEREKLKRDVEAGKLSEEVLVEEDAEDEFIDDDKRDKIEWSLSSLDAATEEEEVEAEGRPSTKIVDYTTMADFQPEPRITEADKTGDVRTIKRSLDRRLHLIVKMKQDDMANGSPSEPVWRFPYGVRNEEEILMEAAKRNAKEAIGGTMDLYYLTKRCAGHHFYEYTDSMKKKTGKFGACVFFYRAQRIVGHAEIHNDKDIVDYAWIRSDELNDFVPDSENDPYWKYARLFLED